MTTASSYNAITSLSRLDAFLHEVSRRSQNQRPTAVFDCDGTIIKGDIGEAMFFNQLEHFLFLSSPADVWADYPEPEKLHTMFGLAGDVAATQRLTDPHYQSFMDLMLSWYFQQLAEGNTAKACADIVRLFSGFTPDQVRTIAADTLREELHSPVSRRTLGSHAIAKGIRYIKESGEVLKQLQAADVDIWVVSGSNTWGVEAVFWRFRFQSDRVIGIELIEDHGVLTPVVAAPVPVLEGKVEAIKKCFPWRPDIVVSDSLKYDSPLFDYSGNLKLLVRSSDRETDSSTDPAWVILEPITLIADEAPWLT